MDNNSKRYHKHEPVLEYSSSGTHLNKKKPVITANSSNSGTLSKSMSSHIAHGSTSKGKLNS